MEQNEFLLKDRINIIKDYITKYGEDKFYISFSGGKDSTILHYLIDMALPNNNIPRVFNNTGIEYQKIVEFVKSFESDKRFVILPPKKNVKQTLEKVGYPFKSKEHSLYVATYQKKGAKSKTVYRYLHPTIERQEFKCPKKLEYQFTKKFKIKVSSKCCDEFKKKPLREYEKQSGRNIAILGLMVDEKGQRSARASCFTKYATHSNFNPLIKVDKKWENWFINKYKIKLCDLYYPPYNFKRTGCKGCPYNVCLEEDLKTMEMLLPNEYKQCEFIWQPIYQEYRRINYRLSKVKQLSLNLLGDKNDN